METDSSPYPDFPSFPFMWQEMNYQEQNLVLLKPQLHFFSDWAKGGGGGALGTQGCDSVQIKLSTRPHFSGQQTPIPHILLDMFFPIRRESIFIFLKDRKPRSYPKAIPVSNSGHCNSYQDVNQSHCPHS